MNAYLLSAEVICTRVAKALGKDYLAGEVGLVNQVQQWDDCVNYIMVATSVDSAEQRLIDWLKTPQDDPSMTREVREMVISQLIDRLFGEAGESALDWPAICERARASLEGQTDYFEQGSWVDANTAFPSEELPKTIEALQAAVAPDVAEGLNWSAEKKFFFIVNALRAQPSLAPAEGGFSIFEETREEGEGNAQQTLPGLVEREATALVEARNAVAAVWVWKRFAATTPMAQKPVQIIPWCGVAFEMPETGSAPEG